MFKLGKRMKLSIGCIMMVGVALGQGLTGYGAKLGLSHANVSSDSLDAYAIDTQARQSYVVGVYATFDAGLPVFFQIEVLYSQKGANWDRELDLFGVDYFDGSAVLSYIDINPFAVYPINANLRLFAGPSISRLMRGGVKAEGDGQSLAEDIKFENINGIDLGFIVGTGYQLGPISVEARYSRGFKSAYKLSYQDLELRKIELLDIKDLRNNVIQIMVGYGL